MLVNDNHLREEPHSLNTLLLKENNYEEPRQSKIDEVKRIILLIKESLIQNKSNQINLCNLKDELSKKQALIEKLLDQIKKINKSKQKKHTKYLCYIPLSKIYYYCQKKIHFYYILLDIVIKFRKKQKLKEKNQSLIANNRDLNRFNFSKIEDQTLKKFIISESNYPYIDFEEISKVLKKTPLQCFIRNLEMSKFYKFKKWSDQEDNILKKAILYYGPKNWQQISYCLEGRNNSQCFHRWMKGINPKIKRDKWSLEEDLTVGIALKIFGKKKWSNIAHFLSGRTDIQCRERFCNILDPSLQDCEWSKSEDLKLLVLYEKYGNKWSKIAKSFGNRTDNMCWRRWKYLSSNMGNESFQNDQMSVTKRNSSIYLDNSENKVISRKELKTVNLRESIEDSEEEEVKEEFKEERQIRRIFNVIKKEEK
jgi:hypothetical protein